LWPCAPVCESLKSSRSNAEHIDLKTGAMLVRRDVVNGRIGRVKTEAPQDEVQPDPAFAAALPDRKGKKTEGLSSLHR
jgi:hypothetical protein